jgi:hypothetical protein
MRLLLFGTLPDSEVDGVIQAIRTWEAGRPDVDRPMAVEAPPLSRAQTRAMLDRLAPHLPPRWEEDPDAP